jgi:hypothetical protein
MVVQRHRSVRRSICNALQGGYQRLNGPDGPLLWGHVSRELYYVFVVRAKDAVFHSLAPIHVDETERAPGKVGSRTCASSELLSIFGSRDTRVSPRRWRRAVGSRGARHRDAGGIAARTRYCIRMNLEGRAKPMHPAKEFATITIATYRWRD